MEKVQKNKTAENISCLILAYREKLRNRVLSVTGPSGRVVWASICGRSLTGIAGSNPAISMDVCLLWVSCVIRYLVFWNEQKDSVQYV